MLKLIVENFESFGDFGEFKGKKGSIIFNFLNNFSVFFKTRANSRFRCLLLFEFNGSDCGFCGYFVIIGKKKKIFRKLTMFADYRVPQVLAFLNVFEYSPGLLKSLKSEKILINGSFEEMVLRGCSIYACDVGVF